MKTNPGFFILKHLMEVALETRKELDITIGAYVTLFANYLKADIYEEKVQGNPFINLTYLIEKRQLLTAWYKEKTEVHVYIHMGDKLLGFVCSETIAVTP